ncbi:hypothetical protein BJ085DRAFT_36998 [Dimargaris cristalligena]|uniref:Uncharacterized protein n=1 Tax=Dimargaris cristalligena TaxID=215637 RepID=A0A4P9ZYE6_9FUNG|nr:hypothetical protein BJ085DRAFT_36998 [Dimargaris cristalligena]|eukprot:RKP38081.1 hypothetical protein BJ085DRAFT_36998 [Dimargaris cristalligena]
MQPQGPHDFAHQFQKVTRNPAKVTPGQWQALSGTLAQAYTEIAQSGLWSTLATALRPGLIHGAQVTPLETSQMCKAAWEQCAEPARTVFLLDWLSVWPTLIPDATDIIYHHLRSAPAVQGNMPKVDTLVRTCQTFAQWQILGQMLLDHPVENTAELVHAYWRELKHPAWPTDVLAPFIRSYTRCIVEPLLFTPDANTPTEIKKLAADAVQAALVSTPILAIFFKKLQQLAGPEAPESYLTTLETLAAETCTEFLEVARSRPSDIKCLGTGCKYIIALTLQFPTPAFRQAFPLTPLLNFIRASHHDQMAKLWGLSYGPRSATPTSLAPGIQRTVNRHIAISKFFLNTFAAVTKPCTEDWLKGSSSATDPERQVVVGHIRDLLGQLSTPQLLAKDLPSAVVAMIQEQLWPMVTGLVGGLLGASDAELAPEFHPEWHLTLFRDSFSLPANETPENLWATFLLRQFILDRVGRLSPEFYKGLLISNDPQNQMPLMLRHILSLDGHIHRLLHTVELEGPIASTPNDSASDTIEQGYLALVASWTRIGRTIPTDELAHQWDRVLFQSLVRGLTPSANAAADTWVLLAQRLLPHTIESQIRFLSHMMETFFWSSALIAHRLEKLLYNLLLVLPSSSSTTFADELYRSSLPNNDSIDRSWVSQMAATSPSIHIVLPLTSPAMREMSQQHIPLCMIFLENLVDHFSKSAESLSTKHSSLNVPLAHLYYILRSSELSMESLSTARNTLFNSIGRYLETMIQQSTNASRPAMSTRPDGLAAQLHRQLEIVFDLLAMLMPFEASQVFDLLELLNQLIGSSLQPMIPLISLLNLAGSCASVSLPSQDNLARYGQLLAAIFQVGSQARDWTVIQETLAQLIHFATSTREPDVLDVIVPDSLQIALEVYIESRVAEDSPGAAESTHLTPQASEMNFYDHLLKHSEPSNLLQRTPETQPLSNQIKSRLDWDTCRRKLIDSSPQLPQSNHHVFSQHAPTSAYTPDPLGHRPVNSHTPDGLISESGVLGPTIPMNLKAYLLRARQTTEDHQDNLETLKQYLTQLQSENTRFDPQVRQMISQIWNAADTILNSH